MIRGVLENGLIRPLEPFPNEWTDGTEVMIEPTREPSAAEKHRIQSWFDELESLAQEYGMNDEEYKQFQDALADADVIAKEQVRREMGLP